MIKHIDIVSLQKTFIVDSELTTYIQKKIGKLDRHMKQKDRASARADVRLQETLTKGGKKCMCEVTLHMGGTTLTATESTINIYAAVDIVENKLQNQIKKYKEKHAAGREKHKKMRTREFLGKIFSR